MKLNKIASLLLGAVVAVGAVSCDEEKYDPTPAYTGNEVYFDKDMSTSLTIPTDADQMTVELYRVKADAELTVGLVSSVTTSAGADASNVISVPEAVTFTAGENVALIPLTIDFPSVVANEVYSVNIAVKGEDLTPYGETAVTLLLDYAPWSDWETESSSIAVQMAGLWDYAYEAPLLKRQSLTDDNLMQYGIPMPFSDVDFAFIFNIDKRNTYNLDGELVYLMTMDRIDTGINNSDGKQFTLWDIYSFAKWNFPTQPENKLIQMAIDNGGVSYYAPERGLFALNQVVMPTSDTPSTSIYTIDYNYFQLPGFKSYTLEFSKVYNLVDDEGTESVVVEAYKSSDVASFAYTVSSGELTEEEVNAAADAIVADGEATLYTDQLTYLMYTPEALGTYTLVAVGYDEDNHEVIRTSYTFEFTSVQSAPEWVSIGHADYTDGFMNTFFTVPNFTWDVEVEEHVNTPGLYRIVNPYLNWPLNVEAQGALVEPGKYYMTIDATDPNAVRVNQSEIGVIMNNKYGMCRVWCLGDVLVNSGKLTYEQAKQQGYYGTLENGSIEFKAGTLVFSMATFQGGNWYNANIDPKNPALDDESIDFDPFYGVGPFYLTIFALEDEAKAPARKQVAAPAPFVAAGSYAVTRNAAYAASRSQVQTSTTISSNDLNKVRFNQTSNLK